MLLDRIFGRVTSACANDGVNTKIENNRKPVSRVVRFILEKVCLELWCGNSVLPWHFDTSRILLAIIPDDVGAAFSWNDNVFPAVVVEVVDSNLQAYSGAFSRRSR